MSAYSGDDLEIGVFTNKELGQLLVLRPEWSEDIALDVWSWNQGQPPPIRLHAEIGIAGAVWMQSLEYIQHAPPSDFRETRPLWHSVAGSINDPVQQIERLAYFGWVWETHHSANVSIATKVDSAGIDLKHWAVSGDNPEM
jgi:hypothetical protein